MHKRGGIAQNFVAPNRFIDKLLQKNSIQMKQTA